MIDLSPPLVKKVVIRERVRRFIVGSGFVIVAILVVGIILLLPSYFFIVFENKEVKRQQDALERTLEREGAPIIEQELSDLMSRASRVMRNSEILPISPALHGIIREAGSDIFFSSLSFVRSDSEMRFDISGIAQQRSSFLSFLEKLREQQFVVNSSPENLLRERNLAFTISIIVYEHQ